jgi:hypothetical protein
MCLFQGGLIAASFVNDEARRGSAAAALTGSWSGRYGLFRQMNKRIAVGRRDARMDQSDRHVVLVKRRPVAVGLVRRGRLELPGAVGPNFPLDPIGGPRLADKARQRGPDAIISRRPNHSGDLSANRWKFP